MPLQPKDLTKTLVEVVTRLNGNFDSSQCLQDVLQSIQEQFAFGAAFIYECDHTQKLLLKEHSIAAGWIQLAKELNPQAFLSFDQIIALRETPIQYIQPDTPSAFLEKQLCAMFQANSIFILFIVDSSDALLGCIGMIDNRRHYPLSEEQIQMGHTLLKLVAERSRLRIYQQRLRYASSTLENIMDHTGFDIYANDYETHEMLYANQSMAAPYGGWKNMRGKPCYAALYEGQTEECDFCPKRQLIDENGNPTKIYSWDYQRPFDKKWFRVISAAFHWTDGRLAQVISSSDITEAKHNELLVKRMAYFDDLTGIPNRRKLEQDFTILANAPTASEKGITVLFLDLNRFKEVNDTYGHAVGDLLLQRLAQTFQSNPVTKDRCYRYGGDEFIFLYPGLSREQSQERSNDITQILSTPLDLNGLTMVCSASVGFSRYPEEGTTYDSLLSRADSDMYTHKAPSRKT